MHISFRNMPAVVIMNFYTYYGEKLNKLAMANIVQRNYSDSHARAQVTLIFHITKLEIHFWLAVLLFTKTEELSIHINLTPQDMYYCFSTKTTR